MNSLEPKIKVVDNQIYIVDTDPAGYGQKYYHFSYSRFDNTARLVYHLSKIRRDTSKAFQTASIYDPYLKFSTLAAPPSVPLYIQDNLQVALVKHGLASDEECRNLHIEL